MRDLDQTIYEALGGEGRREFRPSTEYDRAMGFARDRAERIYRLFEEFRVSPEPGAEEYAEGLPFRFIELPDGDYQRQELSADEFEGRAEVVRLRHELRHPELLLAGRVVDFLQLEGQPRELKNSWRADRQDIPVVQVVREKSAKRGIFPWKVIVRTDDPARYQRAAEEAGDRIGIGIDFAPAVQTRLLGHCQAGNGGITGSVGGVLSDGRMPLLSTCAHVLADGCQSSRFATSPRVHTSQPDTALLHGRSPCFNLSPSAPCQPMNDVEIDDAMVNRKAVAMRSEQRGSRRGIVLCRAAAVPLGTHVCRFPHVQVLAWPTTRDRVLNMFDRAFSAPGDSGNWVFSEEDDRWLGQVVAGMDDLRTSYVTEAGPLLEFLRASLHNPSLAPERFN